MLIQGVAGESEQHPSAAPLVGFSPLVRVARAIPWARVGRGRQRVATFAVFALGPGAAFWIWFLLEVRHSVGHNSHALVYTMPLASLWILLGPMLMQQWEFDLEDLVGRLRATAEAGGWDLKAVESAARGADHGYYWFVVPATLAAPAAFWIAYPLYESSLALRGFAEQATGLAVMLIVGFINSNGMWAAYKSISVVRAATGSAAPEWHPFGPSRANGLLELNRFCWSTAVKFSVGSVLLPSLYVVQSQVPVAAQVIILVFVALLATGGLVLFTVPTTWLRRLGRAQRQRALDTLAPLLQRTMAEAARLDGQTRAELQRRWYTIDIALRLRAEIAALDPVPLPNLVTRAATTLILPALLTIMQIALTTAL